MHQHLMLAIWATAVALQPPHPSTAPTDLVLFVDLWQWMVIKSASRCHLEVETVKQFAVATDKAPVVAACTPRASATCTRKAAITAIKFPWNTGGYVVSPSKLLAFLLQFDESGNTKELQRGPIQSNPAGRSRKTSPSALRNPASVVMSSLLGPGTLVYPGTRSKSNSAAEWPLSRAAAATFPTPLQSSPTSKSLVTWPPPCCRAHCRVMYPNRHTAPCLMCQVMLVAGLSGSGHLGTWA